MSIKKIYSDDPVVPYKTTKIPAMTTRSEIDGLLARWGIRKVYWNWEPEHHDVYVRFDIEETVEDRPIVVNAKVKAPIIWDHKTRNKPEEVNWSVGLRVMFWFLKSHLEAAYLNQYSHAAAFLPYIADKSGQTLKDFLLPHLDAIEQLKSLPTIKKTVIDVDAQESR